jgi:D-methionine transport system ATP-binding protein
VHGGIEQVRGRAFGHLTLELRGDDRPVAEAVTAIRALVETTEVA